MQGLLKQRALSSVVLSVVAAVFSLSSLMMPHRCLLLMSDVGLMSFGFVVVVVVFRSVPSSLTIFGRLALVYDFDCLWLVTLEASCRCGLRKGSRGSAAAVLLPLPPLLTLLLVLVRESCVVGEADVCRQNVGIEDVIG
jgi:hypothetical protein